MVNTSQGPSSGSLPSYKSPPVNEVACGLRFQPLNDFLIPQIGLLWDKFKSEYPRTQHAQPLPSDPTGLPLIDVTTGLPVPRVWFINESDDKLIQIQPDRIYFNWRRRKGAYPRYVNVIGEFEKVVREFRAYLKDLGLGELKLIECDLTYINHIPKGMGWDKSADLKIVFRDFLWVPQKDRFLPGPNKISWSAEFGLPEEKGFLNVNLKHASRKEDRRPLLILELIARGIGESTDDNGIREWFDIAHEWIVRGFTDLTTPEAHRMWEREDA